MEDRRFIFPFGCRAAGAQAAVLTGGNRHCPYIKGQRKIKYSVCRIVASFIELLHLTHIQVLTDFLYVHLRKFPLAYNKAVMTTQMHTVQAAIFNKQAKFQKRTQNAKTHTAHLSSTLKTDLAQGLFFFFLSEIPFSIELQVYISFFFGWELA